MSGQIDAQTLAVAAVYAHAMLELAAEQGLSESVEAELGALVKELLDDNPSIDRFFTSPLVDAEARQAALEKSFRGRASDLLVDGLQVLNRKGRLGLIRALAEAYRLALEEQQGEIDVEVATALPLPEAMRRRLTEATARVSGKKARLLEKVEPALLGGMVVRIGDRKIDSSLATQLGEIHARLLERASEEIQAGRRYAED